MAEHWNADEARARLTQAFDDKAYWDSVGLGGEPAHWMLDLRAALDALAATRAKVEALAEENARLRRDRRAMRWSLRRLHARAKQALSGAFEWQHIVSAQYVFDEACEGLGHPQEAATPAGTEGA